MTATGVFYLCAMADRPRDNTWWIASDGKWYPPTLQPEINPDAGIAPRADVVPEMSHTESTAIPQVLTRVVSAALVMSSAAFVVAAFFGFRYGAALGSAAVSAEDLASAEEVSLGWSSFSLFALVVTGIGVLVWAYQTSKAFDARGTSGRRWRGWWTVGGWFVPIASFILPRLGFNELEKISQVPFTGDDIGDRWKGETRSAIGDLWWLLWVTGLFLYQSTQVFLTDPSVDSGTIATAASLSGVAHVVLAAAGAALVIVVRRIDSASQR
jgi:hypothetical protein